MPRSADPAVKAQQQYDKAVADLAKAEDRLAKAQTDYDSAHFAHERATAWVAYAKNNPDLPAQPSATDAPPENQLTVDDFLATSPVS